MQIKYIKGIDLSPSEVDEARRRFQEMRVKRQKMGRGTPVPDLIMLYFLAAVKHFYIFTCAHHAVVHEAKCCGSSLHCKPRKVCFHTDDRPSVAEQPEPQALQV